MPSRFFVRRPRAVSQGSNVTGVCATLVAWTLNGSALSVEERSPTGTGAPPHDAESVVADESASRFVRPSVWIAAKCSRLPASPVCSRSGALPARRHTGEKPVARRCATGARPILNSLGQLRRGDPRWSAPRSRARSAIHRSSGEFPTCNETSQSRCSVTRPVDSCSAASGRGGEQPRPAFSAVSPSTLNPAKRSAGSAPRPVTTRRNVRRRWILSVQSARSRSAYLGHRRSGLLLLPAPEPATPIAERLTVSAGITTAARSSAGAPATCSCGNPTTPTLTVTAGLLSTGGWLSSASVGTCGQTSTSTTSMESKTTTGPRTSPSLSMANIRR